MYRISKGYCIVCASVWKDNPRALESGLSSVQMHNPTITCLLLQYAFALFFALQGIRR